MASKQNWAAVTVHSNLMRHFYSSGKRRRRLNAFQAVVTLQSNSVFSLPLTKCGRLIDVLREKFAKKTWASGFRPTRTPLKHADFGRTHGASAPQLIRISRICPLKKKTGKILLRKVRSTSSISSVWEKQYKMNKQILQNLFNIVSVNASTTSQWP